MTIPSQSDATDIRYIYVGIAKKFTASKTSKFKKSQVFPDGAFNEARGEIRDLSIVNQNTQDIVPSPHCRSSTAAATLQRPAPYEFLSFFNYEYNPLP